MIIRPKDRQAIIDIANHTLKTPCELWAYGSRVDGSAHEGSDLDLVIRTNDGQPLAIDELMAFKDALQDSTIPILIQTHDWARIPESFHRNIMACHEVMFQSTT